jgi:hypothetical protein
MKSTLTVFVLLVAVGTDYAQSLRPTAPPDLPALPGVPAAPSLQPAPAPAKERTINQLLDEIQAVRAQKAELAKREQTLMAEVRKLVELQSERLTKMGLGTPVQPPVAVDFAVPATPGERVPAPSIPVPEKR